MSDLKFPIWTGTVADISDVELLRRAVQNALPRNYRRGQPCPRWFAVMEAFSLGSTYSKELCRRFCFDPDETVRR